MPSTFGYWESRGNAQSIRYLLHHVGEEFMDIPYRFGPPPDYDTSEWLNDAPTLDLDFPSLPYYFNGEVKLSQSIVILRHIGRKYGFTAKTEEEQQRLDVLELELNDFRSILRRIAFHPEYETLIVEYLKNLASKLKLFSNFLDKHDWFVGNHLTYADFMAYEALDHNRLLKQDCLEHFPNLETFMRRCEEIPAVEKCQKEPAFTLPIFGPTSYFKGQKN